MADARGQGRDMEVIEALYRQHAPALLEYLRRAFGAVAGAEDLLHETFLRAIAGRDKLESAFSPRAWLFAVARRVGIDALRRRRPVAALPEELAGPATAEQDERLSRMRRAIDRLGEPQRQTLELRLLGELTYEEIAAVLDIPLGTVRSRLHNAVRQLRQTLEAGEGA